ncbi:hypothetical protein C489_02026 [Natrinema versiforme JCM 10478]|uniref:Uncharacterized protein n=2 Tax=Natrinema versiforme TaxID=88724 RepID=L9YDX3_9EURY|nr:hypothetical protein C489_02026 [Natrinema versiforme JCM 10478]
MGSSTIGPDSPIERVLEDYGVGASSWSEDLVESDTERLLLALLLEQRGENALEALDTESEDSQEAGYFVTEEPLPITTAEENRLKWGFPAKSVTVWGFDAPIYVAFRSEGDYRKIPLDPEDAPFSVSPQGGLGASMARLRLPSSETENTQVKILAME